MAKRRLQQRTAVALSLEQGKEVFADSGAAVEALQVALNDAEASHTARLTLAVARWIVLGADLANWWKRICLVFGPQAHRFRQARVEALYAREQLEQTKAGVEKAQAALRRADLPEVIRVGRAARDQAARLGAVVDLLGGLTSANHTSNADCERHYRELEGLLANEYRAFASRENYPREADAYAELHKVFARCSELRLAPRLAKRNICAVAGGFSSGKSSFLNALIGERILPTNITPTTSIPTYIFHVDDELSVEAFNHLGGRVPIDAIMFKKMTHDFKHDHGVELKRLVHRVSICTPKLQHWKRLALIDTPGYTNPDNAADGTDGAEQRDEDIALANVLKSQFLIWVVDCEKGTLPEQDIHFIRKFIDQRPEGAENKLYLVFNKGDKKTQEDRQDILQVAKDTAKIHSIPFAGIGIYSSRDNEWYAHQGSPFDAFLQTVDQAQSSGTHGLGEAVQAVFQDYIDYHEQEGDQLGKASGLLNRLSLALGQQEGHLEKLDADLKKRRAYIRNVRKDHGKLRDEARRLQQRFAAAVTGFVEGIGTSTDPQ